MKHKITIDARGPTAENERRIKSYIAELNRGYATGEYSHATRSREELRMDSRPSETQVGGGHYRKYAIQPSEFIHRNKLGWCEGNAVKYLTRHRDKNGRQDIEKAIHYLQLLLEWEYGDG